MEKPGLLNLSDEVLINIFQYLDGMDKINTYRTCRRFNNIFCERKLSRSLRLAGNYDVTMQDIKCYLKPKLRRENLKVLDVTNCYWLLPSEMCAAVLKLKNLVAFYSLDIVFTKHQFEKIMNGLPKLKHLSLSWPECYHIENVNQLSLLEFIYIYLPKYNFTGSNYSEWHSIFAWINCLKHVKQVWLIQMPISYTFPSMYICYPCFLSQTLTLDTLVIIGLGHYTNESGHSRPVCKMSMPAYNCVWMPYIKDDLIEQGDYLELITSQGSSRTSLACPNQRITLGKDGKIKRFYWDSVKEPPFFAGDERFEKLEELGIKKCFSLNLLESLSMLTVLCVPACCLADSKAENESAKFLPKWCPRIQHLEIDLCERCKSISQECGFFLETIAEWPKLKVLKLTVCWKLRCGRAFDQIFRTCKNLEKLYLKNLGAMCGYVFAFTRALTYCQNLKDFRFEENNVTPLQTVNLFQALTQIPGIQRIVVVLPGSNNKNPSQELVIDLIKRLPNLIFLGIITHSMAESWKKSMKKKIAERFLAERPALYCCFENGLGVYIRERYPAIHLFEILHSDITGPFQLPYNKEFFFEVPHLAAIEAVCFDCFEKLASVERKHLYPTNINLTTLHLAIQFHECDSPRLHDFLDIVFC